MKKMQLLLVLTCSMLLAACGQTSQQPATSTQSTGTNSSAPVASAQATAVVHPVDANVLAAAKPTGQPCSFDSDPHLTLGKPHVLRGWLLGPERKPAGAFTLVLQGPQTLGIQATTGAQRSDVGKYLRNAALASAGFTFTTELKAVQPGSYDVKLLVRRGSEAYICDTAKKLLVAK